MVKTQRLIFVVFAVTAVCIIISPWSRSIEERTSLPWLFQLRGPVPAPKNVHVLAIQTEATRRLGLPSQVVQWPRKTHADLITHLKHLGASLIVLDMAFKTERDDDPILADALRNAGNVMLFQYVERETRHIPGAGTVDIQQRIDIPSILSSAALDHANFTLPGGTASVVSTQLIRDFGYGPKAALPLLAARTMGYDGTIDTSPFYINFYGPPGTLSTVALDQLWNDPSLSFQDSVVFVGLAETIQTEQRDVHKTVFTRENGLNISGVEILASVYANLQNDTQIKPSSRSTNIAILLILLSSIYLIYNRLKQNPIFTLTLLLAGLFPILVFIALRVFEYQQLWVSFFLPCLLSMGLYMLMYALRYRENSRAKKALTNYVPNHVAEALTQTHDVNLQQHSAVEGICLMTDLQGYSTLSETLSPEALHDLLNAYYSALEKTVSTYGGEVANIVGDSLLAIWYSGEDTQSESPKLYAAALEAAHAIMTAKAGKKVDALLLKTSIGLHSGPFSLGHLGAGQHYEYAPVGDTVNTVARIEKLNRKLKTRLLISETVMLGIEKTASQQAKNCLKSQYTCLGNYSLHNKSQTVLLYTPNSNFSKPFSPSTSVERTSCLDISGDALP